VPTFYIDFENGNDAAAGTSFATRWRTMTSGATAARIAPGDTIRIMASPDLTNMGNATWTGGGRPSSVNISSSTNATPIVITTSSAHGLVAGDYVFVAGHTVNTNANGTWKVGTVPTGTTFQILQIDGSNTTGNGVGGATGNVTNANGIVVKTATPLIQNIALCGGLGQKPAWTASANVTTGVGAGREGNGSASFSIAAAFTTGKAAYYTLPSTLDLSGYQQVSFWMRQFGPYGAAGQMYLALCTDTIGDTVANQCNFPAPVTNSWFPVTVNLGTNLNAAIRSVALYVVTDLGAQSLVIDNITASKAASSADSLTLTSLVSKSDGTGDEAWYTIDSVNYDVIVMSAYYTGTTGTVTTYKRETVKTPAGSGVDGLGVGIVQDSGTAGNVIAYSGGWNRTDMSTQTGVTWLDGQNGTNRGITAAGLGQNFWTMDRVNLCRYGQGLSFTASDITIGNMYITASALNGSTIGVTNSTITNFWSYNNNGNGLTFGGFGSTITNVKLVASNNSNGLAFSNSSFQTVGSLIGSNNGSNEILFTGCFNCTVVTATLTGFNSLATGISSTLLAFDNFVNGGSSSGHAQGVNLVSGQLYLNNFTINEATEVSSSVTVPGFVYANRLDDTDNNSWVFQPSIGTVNQQTAVVDSPATTAWRMRPTTTTASANSPLLLKLGTVVCAASSAVTVTARMQRDNTQLTMRLICPGGQITGVSTSVSSDMTAAANTWETVSITFTPTEAGAVDIYAHAFGGTTRSGYVCNLTATQV
jgi:hypothetical protein